MDLQDKLIVVLGGTSGIGLAIAHAAQELGGHPVVVSSRQSKVAAALSELSPGAKGHTVDLSTEASIGDLFGELGPIDHRRTARGSLSRCSGSTPTSPSYAASGT